MTSMVFKDLEKLKLYYFKDDFSMNLVSLDEVDDACNREVEDANANDENNANDTN